MRAKIDDKRIIENSTINLDVEYEVFTFSEDEKETSCVYDHRKKKWKVSTSVSSHITRLLKINNFTFIDATVNVNGTVTWLSVYLEKNQVGFRKGC